MACGVTKSVWRLIMVSLLASQFLAVFYVLWFFPGSDAIAPVRPGMPVVASRFSLLSRAMSMSTILQPAVDMQSHALAVTPPQGGVRSLAVALSAAGTPPAPADPGAVLNMSIPEARRFVAEHNRRQTILNGEKFGPVSPDAVVLVVQVHCRVRELKLFLEGLANVDGVKSTLLVISMDFISAELNELLAGITFCRVLPLYYSKSIQLYPHEFPGTDPYDCSPSMTADQAKAADCHNAANPDRYGHYRDAAITATKHHWWWKCAFVFDKVAALRHHTGLKIFLEEDHYLSPDFLHLLTLMESYSKSADRPIDFYSLGKQRRRIGKRGHERFAQISVGDFDQFEYGQWYGPVHNMGFGFKRSVWETVKACSELFCQYDDYNWDWTLFRVSTKCRSTPFRVLAPLAPRVYHFGMCGVHFKMENCNPADALAEYRNFLHASTDQLSPKAVGIVNDARKPREQKKSNGGWGDLRDVQLCQSFVAS